MRGKHALQNSHICDKFEAQIRTRTKPFTAGRFFEMRLGLAAFQLLLLYLIIRDGDTVFYGRAFMRMLRCMQKAFDCAPPGLYSFFSHMQDRCPTLGILSSALPWQCTVILHGLAPRLPHPRALQPTRSMHSASARVVLQVQLQR